MLDKETVKKGSKRASLINSSSGDDVELAECLERAKNHLNRGEVKECFDRAIGLECIDREL